VILTALLFGLAFVPMIFEARIAARNTRALRSAGAAEPHGDVYRLMQVAYPLCFAAMVAEGWVRGARADATTTGGLLVFVCAKGLKYWAILTLGQRWTFRVLVPPHSVQILAGPYRLMRHPNYLAVVGELAGMALMAHAPVAGALSITGFGLLLLARIRVEERALGLRK
jgi:methyltransferase